jgi:hypothetical protein
MRRFAAGKLVCMKSIYQINEDCPHIDAYAGDVLSDATVTRDA